MDFIGFICHGLYLCLFIVGLTILAFFESAVVLTCLALGHVPGHVQYAR